MSCFLNDWRVSIFGSIVEFVNYATLHIDGIIKYEMLDNLFLGYLLEIESLLLERKLVDIKKIKPKKLSFVFHMEAKVSFERFLFGDGNNIVIDDMEFCVDRIVMLPKIRPHQLVKAVGLSVEYSKLADFRRKLLEKSYECPVLIYQLYKRGILVFEEIEPILKNRDTFLLCCYFRKEIKDYESFIESKYKPYGFDESFFENENDIDQLIEYGFLQSSIEYCLKYDVIDDLAFRDNINQETRWSLFEWSNKPEYLDLLSFAGFYGSIKCFKHLLMKGFEINENVLSMVVSAGCFDLFHLCHGQQFLTPNLVCKASEFFHQPLLVFMIENGADINSKELRVDFL